MSLCDVLYFVPVLPTLPEHVLGRYQKKSGQGQFVPLKLFAPKLVRLEELSWVWSAMESITLWRLARTSFQETLTSFNIFSLAVSDQVHTFAHVIASS